MGGGLRFHNLLGNKCTRCKSQSFVFGKLAVHGKGLVRDSNHKFIHNYAALKLVWVAVLQ